nr:retrovirus-related Pol polyprotein from transposon TNT 1-94 [Tanacetum cinerariifolium]
FVTEVKLNRGLRDSNYDQLYSYLKQHENQATTQDGKVVIQNVQGRQNRGQGNNARGVGAAGYGRDQNKVGYANPGQARQIKCYNCNGGQDNVIDDDVDEQPIQDLALNVDNMFQADDCDAFDSNVDEAPILKQKKDGIFINLDKYVAKILRKFGLTEGKSASTLIDTEKPLLKDPDGENVDVHTYSDPKSFTPSCSKADL